MFKLPLTPTPPVTINVPLVAVVDCVPPVIFENCTYSVFHGSTALPKLNPPAVEGLILPLLCQLLTPS